MIKKIAFVMIAFLMLMLFAGCGGGEKPKQSGQDMKSAAAETAKPTESKGSASSASSGDVKGVPADQNKSGSISVATDKSAELPKNYPSDIFPVYPGGYIYSAITADASYALTVYSKDDVKKVISFYEKVLEGAKANMNTKTEESLTSMGTKGGYAYTMDVGKSSEKGWQTVISIALQPAK